MTEDCAQRKMRFIRYTHNRCAAFNPNVTAAPDEEERREAAGELAELALSMRDDVAGSPPRVTRSLAHSLADLTRLNCCIMSALHGFWTLVCERGRRL